MITADRETPGEDGTKRKAHYGDGEQPWDIIVRMGWGAPFAAGNVIKYLRRTKDPEHSLESARWYYDRVIEIQAVSPAAVLVFDALLAELTNEEIKRLLHRV